MGKRKKDPKIHVLSSKLYFNKTANTTKLNNVQEFIKQYRDLCVVLCDYLWDHPDVKKLSFLDLRKQETHFLKEKAKTQLSSKAFQCAYKQTLGIVQGTIKKYNERVYVYNKLVQEGKTKEAERLKKVIDKHPISRTDVSNIKPMLSEQIVSFDLNNDHKNSFDIWLCLNALGIIKPSRGKDAIAIPLKKTKHFNHLLKIGRIKKSIILDEKYIQFAFEIDVAPKKEEGTTEGVDIGISSPMSLSSGIQINEVFENFNASYNHNAQPRITYDTIESLIKHEKDVANMDLYCLKTILTKLSRRKKGSKGFKRTQQELESYLNLIFKILEKYCKEKNIKVLNVENIKYIKFGKRLNRMLKHWSATSFRTKFHRLMLSSGVQINFISPTYTSQRCSHCGWTQKSNRKGIVFHCLRCGKTANADMNAALNIKLGLPAISKEDRQKKINRKGFYWNSSDQEPMVPGKSKNLNTEYFSIV